ncbi:MAG TPA: nucleotide exchange factor GrpE [Vicinamibacterales bacterium]|jgi:molecular chaperone GrpE|nr:nucleotide exchange factor GrpE [Vicinamibacterales bacterium]
MPDQDPVKVVDRRRWAHGEDAVGGDPAARKPTFVEELEEKLAQREKEAEEYLAKYRQASKEFEDARARMRKELAKDAERSRREVLIGLLEVVDNLDRAIDAAVAAGKNMNDPLLQGVAMVRDQFLAKLEGFGVKRIAADDEAFDPLLHEAVSAVPATDPSHDGRIAGIVRHGYRIGDEVLRPALVAVAKAGPSAELTAPGTLEG